MEFTKCKVTGQKIPVIFNFGKMPIANNFSKKVNKKNLYQMKIAFNESNGLFQLVNAPKPKKLFNNNMHLYPQHQNPCRYTLIVSQKI